MLVSEHFYPRSPRGERLFLYKALSSFVLFLSTLPARGATILRSAMAARRPQISIHAPREGSDGDQLVFAMGGKSISIHAPREGSDLLHPAVSSRHAYISIHAPREGSDAEKWGMGLVDIISIHAPREGSDARTALSLWIGRVFLSTLPARGATSVCRCCLEHVPQISIHAPREGSDR